MSEQQLSTARYFASSREEADQVEQPKKAGPGWNNVLTAICIMFLVVGLFGALSSAWGFSGLFSKPEETTRVARSSAEREIQKVKQAAADAQQKYFPMLLYLQVVKLAVAGAFLFGAVYLLSRNANARKFAIGVCCAALFYNVCSLGISILTISETGGAVNSMLDDLFSQLRFNSDDQKDKMRAYVENSMLNWVTIALAVSFLVKLVFYGAILAYLWTDDVKKVFGEDPLEYLKALDEENNAGAVGAPA